MGTPCRRCGGTERRVSNYNCVACSKEHAKKYRTEQGSLIMRGYYLKKKYGISLDDYEKMHSDINGCCEICGEPSATLNVDHCHKSGSVRGLLCFHCNLGLGYFKDKVSFLERATVYLRKQNDSSTSGNSQEA